jgi:hypothetical protein
MFTLTFSRRRALDSLCAGFCRGFGCYEIGCRVGSIPISWVVAFDQDILT